MNPKSALRQFLLLAVSAVLTSPSAFAVDTTTSAWNGSTVAWGTSGNWAGGVPSSTISALFDSTFISAFQPQLQNAQESQGIYLKSGAGQDVTITGLTSARVLTITGTAELGGQTSAGIILDDDNSLAIGNLVTTTLGNNTGFYVNSAGTLNLNGTGTLNLNTKTLTLGGNNSSGSISISQVITATAGAINVNTSGTVTLSGVNVFTGGLTLTGGTLKAKTSTGALGNGALALNGGILDFNHSAALAFNRNTTVGGNVTIISQKDVAGAGVTYTLGTLGIGANTLTVQGGNVTSVTAGLTFGATTFSGNTIFDVSNPAGGGGTTLTLGALSQSAGAKTITKQGNGTLTLGTAANSLFTGSSIDVTAGTLIANVAGSLSSVANTENNTTVNVSSTGELRGTVAGSFKSSGAGTPSQLINLSAGSLRLYRNAATDLGGNLVYTGGTVILDRTANGGTLTQTMGSLSIGVFTLTPTRVNYTAAPTLAFGSTTITGNAILDSSNVIFSLGTLGIGANTLTTQGANAVTAGATTLSTATIFDVGNTAPLTLGAITGGFGITKNGSGTLTLSGASDSSGSTAVNFGTLNIQHATALGDTAVGTTVADGAALSIQNNITVGAEALSLNGTGISSGGALRNISGNNTYGGLITLAGAARINSDLNLLTLDVASGDAITGTQNLTFGGAGSITVTDPISIGSGTLTKDGAGTLTLSGDNSYNGGTTVSAGTLAVGHANALGTGTIALNGGTIQSSDATARSFGNAVTIGGDFTVGGTGDMTFSNTGDIALGNTRQITVTTAGVKSTFAQAFSGSSVGITKAGSGILELTGANTYSGTTTISAGTLILSGGNSSAGATTVSGGTLQLNNASNGGLASGTFTVGAVTVQALNADRTIAQGITLSGNPTFSGNYSLTSKGQMNGNGGNRIVTTDIAAGKTLTIASYNRGSNNYSLTFDGTGHTIVEGTIYLGNTGGGLTKNGTGTLVLNGDATARNQFLINQGTVIARSARALGDNGNNQAVNLAVGAAMNYVAATDVNLTITSASTDGLIINGGVGTTIGGSIGSSATSARINVTTDRVLVPTPDVKVNVYGVSGVTRPSGTTTYTLISGLAGGATTLNDGNYTLGTVFNNTDFTVGAITKSTTNLMIEVIKATALSGNVYWKGGLTGNTGVWAASDGTATSNWQVTDTVNQPLLPGATADLVFSTDTSPGTMAGMTLGADMSVRTVTINDTTTAFSLNADGYKLTITPSSSSAGITIGSGVLASTIDANIVLGAAQTWTQNSANALTVNGVVSGANSLTKAGTGTVTFSSANTYTSTTTINAGVLNILNNTALGTTAGGTTVASDAALTIQGGITVGAEALSLDGGISTGGALRNISGNNTYGGLITLAGAARINSDAGLLSLNVASGDAITGTQNLTFGGAGSITVADPITISSGTLTKDGAGNLTLTGVNTYTGATTVDAGTLEIGGGGSLNSGNYAAGISIASTSGGTLRFNSTANQILSGEISGAGALVKDNTNTLTLSGANICTGAISINAGVLNIQHATALGDTAAGASVASGAALEIQNNITVGAEALSLNGAGISDGGALRNISGTNTYGGLITLAGDTRINSDLNLLTLDVASGNAITGTTHNLTFGGAGNITVADPINIGTGTLTKDGSATLTLSGTNTYTGATAINEGTLALGVTNALPELSNVILQGGTLDIGTVSNSAGTLAVTGNATLALGDGSGRIAFADSSAVSWLGGALQLAGTLGASTVYVGVGGLSQDQLDSITYAGGTIVINAQGYLAVGGSGEPPELVSFVDDRGGATVGINIPVTYTVTFSKAMDTNTVTSADFGNASNATITVGTVLQTGNPAVFTVPVTATTGGGLQLQVNEGAVLKDLFDQALDTTPAILDDTIITVDAIEPTIVPPTVPADDATDVAITTNLVATFNENIAVGSGNIVITNLTDGTATNIAVTDGTQVTVSGMTLTINPTNDLLLGKAYAVLIDSGAVKDDPAGNPFAGITSTSVWSFVTTDSTDGTWSGGNGNWSNPSLWTGGIIANGADHTAYTDRDGNQTLTVNTPRTIGNISFSSGHMWNVHTITGSGANTLTLAVSSGTPSIRTTSRWPKAVISAPVAGEDGLQTIAGGDANGVIVLSGNNTYSGVTTLGSGTLWVGSDTALGVSTITWNGGGLAASDATARTLANPIAFTGNVIIGKGHEDNQTPGTGALTFSDTSATALGATRTFTIDSGLRGNFAQAFSGSGFGITKANTAGTLELSGASTYDGTTTVSGGTLIASGATALGDTATGTTVASGAALAIQGGITLGAEALSLNGTGISSGGALCNISGDNTYGGLITLAGATRINSDAGLLTLNVASGDAIAGTQNLTFGGAGNITVADPISIGTGTLTKDGAGTLTLSGTNSYTGTTVLAGGTLALGDASSSLGTLTLNGNATIALGSGELAFANSSALAWSGSLSLTGTLGATTLRFGTDASGLTEAQLRNITYIGKPVTLDANGYVVVAGTLIIIR